MTELHVTILESQKRPVEHEEPSDGEHQDVCIGAEYLGVATNV